MDRSCGISCLYCRNYWFLAIREVIAKIMCYFATHPFVVVAKSYSEKIQRKKTILNLLAKEIDTICKKERILFSSFLFVSEFDRLLMDNLQNLNYLKSPGITSLYLDIQWSSFEDYLKCLKRKTRENIRREIKKFKENGVRIEEHELERSLRKHS